MATFVWLHEMTGGTNVEKRLVNMDHVIKTIRFPGPPAYTMLVMPDKRSMNVYENEETIAALIAAYGVAPPETLSS